jgi:hypothetical protein
MFILHKKTTPTEAGMASWQRTTKGDRYMALAYSVARANALLFAVPF